MFDVNHENKFKNSDSYIYSKHYRRNKQLNITKLTNSIKVPTTNTGITRFEK